MNKLIARKRLCKFDKTLNLKNDIVLGKILCYNKKAWEWRGFDLVIADTVMYLKIINEWSK